MSEAAKVADLAMLVRRLVHALQTRDPGNKLCGQAIAYLKREGLAGSPLRELILEQGQREMNDEN